jgi:peptidase E
MSFARQIIAIGGAVSPSDAALFPYVLAQARRPRPRVGFLPTASGDSPVFVDKFYEQFGALPCEPTHLPLFDRVTDVSDYIARQDVILVSGGNTKSMLGVWREWRLDELLRDAWIAGTVLAGFSAGAICWFSEGLSDSWADGLHPLPGIGLLPGSCCPHYSSELERRPAFQRLISRGAIAPGIGIDDGAAVHFRDESPTAVVTAREGVGAYVVELNGGVVSESAARWDRVCVGS